MNEALAILVLLLILLALAASGHALGSALRKRRRPARARTLSQHAIAFGGYVALGVPIRLLQPRLGWMWTLDLLLLVFGAWSIIVSVVLFGVPYPTNPGEPRSRLTS